jgi:hypothetical protein
MKILFSPVRSDEVLSLHKLGDTLVVNGEAFDFSPMGVGDVLPVQAISSSWFARDVERTSDGLVFTIVLPNPANYSQQQAFPEPLLNVLDGEVPLPQPLPDNAAVMELPV